MSGHGVESRDSQSLCDGYYLPLRKKEKMMKKNSIYIKCCRMYTIEPAVDGSCNPVFTKEVGCGRHVLQGIPLRQFMQKSSYIEEAVVVLDHRSPLIPTNLSPLLGLLPNCTFRLENTDDGWAFLQRLDPRTYLLSLS